MVRRISTTADRRRRPARVGAGVLVAALLLVCCPFSPAGAGGIWLYEMATPDQGTAAAGRAALAVDASTAWLNPAGMTRSNGPSSSSGPAPS